ncbi:unnamed protein product [Cylicocyclus nassatus]|uniref:Uncharacterized protein n=1 Tax=Cylicocyclus nassatus TaxID=53992 RepID=A0AA36DRX7_CYLNA|nr:unnamed protein product [Cylicocyclus nassatus]
MHALILALVLAATLSLGIAKDCDYLDDDYRKIFDRHFYYYRLKYRCELEKEAYQYFVNRKEPPKGHYLVERRYGNLKKRELKQLVEKMIVKSMVKYKSSKAGCYIGEVLNGKEKQAIICVFASNY